MAAAHPAKASRPHVVKYIGRFLGANNADLTIEEGNNMKTAARTGEGAYRLTFNQDPGLFLGLTGFGFQATTPGDLKGYTVVVDAPYDATNLTLDFVVYDSTFTAADLIAAQWVTLELAFSEHGV
jgi:hypothetical protein